MSAPVGPNDFKALIPDPTSSFCGMFTNVMLKLPVAIYKLVNWMLDTSGNPSQAFRVAVNATGTYEDSACVLTEDGSRLLCDGREVSQATYANLFAAIGATYGTASDPVHNFKLPDWRAKFPVGMGTFASGKVISLGVADGEEKHILLPAETALRGHTHAMSGNWVKYGGGSQGLLGSGAQGDGGANTGGMTSGESNGTAHNNLPPFLGQYRYIRT